jgi:hypothetical protein
MIAYMFTWVQKRSRTHHTVLFDICWRHLPIKTEDLVNDDLDGVRPDIDSPLQLRDGVVHNTPSEMTMRLERKTTDVTCRICSRASAHRNRISRVIDMGDVVRRGLHPTNCGVMI